MLGKEEGCLANEPIYSRALPDDGALIWELPPRITEEGLSNRHETLKTVSQCFREVLDGESKKPFRSLVRQLLDRFGVPNKTAWLSVVVDISEQLSGLMSNKRSNERGLLLSKDGLKIELFPMVGAPSDSCVIRGIVLRRNIANRFMRTKIHRPKLLLVSGALELEYHKLTQLHTVINKETEFLDTAVKRILAAAPDVCVIERSASFHVVNLLQKANVTLVCNVPMADMTSLAISTNTKIVQNIPDIEKSCIGTCSEFYIIQDKSPKSLPSPGHLAPPLMVFEVDCGHSTCTVALRGGSESELKQVQKALSFAVKAAFRLLFENAFLQDTLSIATESTAAYGVEGLEERKDIEDWRPVCRGIVQQSSRKTSQKRLLDERVDFVSPHMSSWTARQSHGAFKQKRVFSQPEYYPCEMSDNTSNSEQPASIDTAATSDPSHSIVKEPDEELNCKEQSVESINDVGVSQSKNPEQAYSGIGMVRGALDEDSISVRVQTLGDANEAWTSNAVASAELDRSIPGGEGQRSRAAMWDAVHSRIRRTCSADTARVNNGYRQDEQALYPYAWSNWSDVENLKQERSPFSIPGATMIPFLGDSHLSPSFAENLTFSASFAKRNHRKGWLCEPCHVMTIDSRKDRDLTLLDFLMSITAEVPKRCPAGCGGGNSSHQLTFLHGAVRFTISVISLPRTRAYPNAKTDIWFWARPKGVASRPMSSVCQAPLSEDAKSLSLAQFLQLLCNTQDLKVFGRSLFLEHIIYFGYGQTVACIYGNRIRLKPVCAPAPVVDYGRTTQINWLKTSADHLLQEVDTVYDAIQKSCFPSLTTDNSAKTPKQMEDEMCARSSLIPDLLREKDNLSEEIRSLIDGINIDKATSDGILECYLELNQLWRQLGINVLSLSATMNDPLAAAMNMDLPFEDISLSIGTRISDSLVVDAPRDEFLLSSRLSKRLSHRLSAATYLSGTMPNETHGTHPGDDVGPLLPYFSDLNDANGQTEAQDDASQMETPFMTSADRPFPPSPFVDPQSVPNWAQAEPTRESADEAPVIMPDCRHQSIDLMRSPSITAIMSDGEAHVDLRPSSSVGNIMDLFDQEAQKFTEEQNEDLYDFRQRSVSVPSSPPENRLLNQLERRLNFGIEDDDFASGSDSGEYLEPLHDQSNIQGLTKRPSNRGYQTPGAQTPLPGTEIRLSCRALIPLGNDDLVIPVFDAEPTSIIAHVLSSISYHRELQHSFDYLASHPVPLRRNPESSGEMESSATESVCSRSVTAERPIRSSKSNQFHIFQRFEDNPPGMTASRAKFEVVSYFAPQFTKMRGRCISGGERSFVLSMSRSRRWEASGGKSNAYFAKTLDDRYIVKSLSKIEKATFLDKLGPSYFNYMEEQHCSKQDVCLAKCLGLFQVSMKSYSSRGMRVERTDNGSEADLGRDWVLDLIILENVFYGRNCSSVYDLKGCCHRRRFNDEAEKKTGEKRGVYWDLNLKKHNASDPPLLVDQATLNTLAEMLRRDTDFLLSNSVMDYSLLVGVDHESNCIVVAIIDYVRQYTWDKRLESWVKSSVIMGDGCDEPTIISPDAYRKRFLSSVIGYFTVVPCA